MVNVKNKKITFLLFFVFQFSFLYAQINNESSTQQQSIQKKLESYIKLKENKDLKSSYKNFSKILSENKDKETGRLLNFMIQKKMKPNSHFRNFFESYLLVFSSDNHDLDSWINVLQKVLQENTINKFNNFLIYSIDLVQLKSIRKTKTLNWSYSDCKVFFDYVDQNPVVVFSEPTNLMCSTKGNSININLTRGKYYPFENKWNGEEGVVDWSTHSISSDSIYVILDKYKIDTRSTKINCDSVSFYNKYLFDKPLKGKFQNRISIGKMSQTYPRFSSYSKKIFLEEIFNGIDYEGGYMLNGKKFIADGGKYADAKIIFKKNGKKLLVAESDRFNLESKSLTSSSCALKIYFDNDSIFHSDLKLKYFDDERKLQLFNSINTSFRKPMINSYHKMSIYFEMMEWSIDSSLIEFGSVPGASISNVEFESLDFFDEKKYDMLAGIDEIHPLILISNYVRDKQENIFYVSDFAKYIGYPILQVKNYLINLSNYGFLFYDSGEERIYVQESVEKYIRAKSKLSDYDVISFVSSLRNNSKNKIVNAAINLENKDLMIAGVRDITLSKTQSVFLKPFKGRLVFKKNRDFTFSGFISAGSGRFNLFGKKFDFIYDDFKINLNKIDSVRLKVPKLPVRKDMYGNELLTDVKTVLQSVTGDLVIDNENNKSGIYRDSFPNYPIFRSFERSFVYYDDKSIFNSVYDRENFYFHLDPFEIDSLENYSGKGLAFSGDFVSAGIFNNFSDTLKLQDDYSLGFSKIFGDTGEEIYGKTKYYNNINLSNKGLKGNGRLEYLNSTYHNKEVFFFPDSAILLTDSIFIDQIKDGIEFPDVKNSVTISKYLPFQDKVFINKIDSSFSFYANQASFDGRLCFQPIGLSGSGKMKLDNSEVHAQRFNFNAEWFKSDTADLFVYNGDKLSFETKNLRTNIDIYDKQGTFFSNGIMSSVNFVTNNYFCRIDKLNWDIRNDILEFGDSLNQGSFLEFVSTSSTEDSLSFEANYAKYDLSIDKLEIYGINSLVVADAEISNTSSKIFIENGRVESLENCNITLVDSNTNYKFYDCKVDILDANKYFASGNYNFKHENQKVFFDSIYVTKDFVTNAKASIEKDKEFKINNKFKFYGTLKLFRNSSDFNYNGYFKISSNCLSTDWVSFNSKLNLDSLVINLDKNSVNEFSRSIYYGHFFSSDSLTVYPVLMNKKLKSNDESLLTLINKITLTSNDTFIFGQRDSSSSYFSFHDESCKSVSTGKVNLISDVGRVKIDSYGNFTTDNNLKSFEGFLLFDFFFNDEALQLMVDDIYSAPGDLDFNFDENYLLNLCKVVGTNEAENLYLDLEVSDEFAEFPSEMASTLNFTNVNLVWNSTLKSYVSNGYIGLGNILNNQINSLLEGKVILDKKRNKNQFTIYLKTEFDDIYYFNYKNGIMKCYSSNDDFMNIIKETKDSKRQAKQRKNQKPYKYTLETKANVERFIKNLNKYN